MGKVLEALLAVIDEAAVIILLISIGVYILYTSGTISLAQALVILAGLGAATAFLVYKVVEAHSREVKVGPEALIGARGRVVEDLDPEGMVIVGGELWRAVSAGGVIPKGSIVRVKSMEDLTLIVEAEE
ncbi:MAG: hypothetical protein F7B18_06710 [Desulfurococcales archaeon]|nr:hypothetical protein [Desulfurococcales archaeon]